MAMKGNERLAFQQNQVRRQFANMMASGEVTLVDRMGAPVQVGDLVLLSMPDPPMGRVVDIKPIVDPRQPAGLATATIVFEFPLTARAGLPMRNLVIVARPEPTEGEPAEGDQKPASEEYREPKDGSPAATKPSGIVLAD